MPKTFDLNSVKQERDKKKVDYKHLKKEFAKVSDPAAKKLLQEIYKLVIGE